MNIKLILILAIIPVLMSCGVPSSLPLELQASHPAHVDAEEAEIPKSSTTLTFKESVQNIKGDSDIHQHKSHSNMSQRHNGKHGMHHGH